MARRRAPATTPEAREDEIIASAINLAEKQIEEGTASSQVITHFLKLGSSREKLEQEKLRKENELLVVKKETMEAAQRLEGLFEDAINAMREYKTGRSAVEERDEYDELEP
jgi:putative cell wall-binding protein